MSAHGEQRGKIPEGNSGGFAVASVAEQNQILTRSYASFSRDQASGQRKESVFKLLWTTRGLVPCLVENAVDHMEDQAG